MKSKSKKFFSFLSNGHVVLVCQQTRRMAEVCADRMLKVLGPTLLLLAHVMIYIVIYCYCRFILPDLAKLSLVKVISLY